MAKLHDFTKPCKVTITNVMDPNDSDLVNKDALTGERRIISLAEAKASGFTDFEYLLDKDGNFVIDPASGASVGTPVDSDNVLVIVRQSVQSTDRLVQFFSSQQKVLLAAGDSITFECAVPAAVAHYLALSEVDGLEVNIVGADTKEVITEAELTAALTDAEVKQVKLTADVALTANLAVATAGKTIDGGGYTVTPTVGSGTQTKDGVLVSAADTTLSNMTITVAGVADKAVWSSNYGIQVYNTSTTISDVKVSGANAAILVNGGTVTMTGTIDVSGSGFGGIEVSKGSGATGTPLLDASKATFVNTDEAYGKPTIWIDGYSALGDGVVKAPAGMTKVVYTEDSKDQLHFYINAANAKA